MTTSSLRPAAHEAGNTAASKVKYWNDVYQEPSVYGTRPSLTLIRVVRCLRVLQPPLHTFLDLGCGYGKDLFFAASALPRFRSFLGIDFSSKALRTALSFARRRQGAHNTVRFICANLQRGLPVEPQAPLVLFSHFFLQTLTFNDRGILAALLRERIPSGSLLFLGEYSRSHPLFLSSETTGESGTVSLRRDGYEHSVHFFSKSEILAYAQRLGASVLYTDEFRERETIRGARIVSSLHFGILSFGLAENLQSTAAVLSGRM